MNSKWPKTIPIGGLTSTLLIYEITTAREMPSQALAVMQYCLLGGALFALVGSIAMPASGK